MRHAPRFDEFLRGHGQQIFGTQHFALSRVDSATAIGLAREEGVAILGGDIFELQRGRLRPANRNWFSDPRSGETEQEFARRSWFESETFLLEFDWEHHPDAFVVFTRAP